MVKVRHTCSREPDPARRGAGTRHQGASIRGGGAHGRDRFVQSVDLLRVVDPQHETDVPPRHPVVQATLGEILRHRRPAGDQLDQCDRLSVRIAHRGGEAGFAQGQDRVEGVLHQRLRRHVQDVHQKVTVGAVRRALLQPPPPSDPQRHTPGTGEVGRDATGDEIVDVRRGPRADIGLHPPPRLLDVRRQPLDEIGAVELAVLLDQGRIREEGRIVLGHERRTCDGVDQGVRLRQQALAQRPDRICDLGGGRGPQLVHV